MANETVPELQDWPVHVPRPKQVILAELRECAEQFLGLEDHEWFKQNFPNVWPEGQLEMW